MTEDVQLIRETLDGQSAAFGQLVRRYQDRLYNTMVLVTGSRHDAQQVVQEALVQALLELDWFPPEGTFCTWLYRIAFRVAGRGCGRGRSGGSPESACCGPGRLPGGNPSKPAAEADGEQHRQLVHQALAQLDDEHRAVLVLREMDGCCYETISEILELSVGTVRSRLHRARLQLREELKHGLVLED